MNKRLTTYKCPLCGNLLSVFDGDEHGINPANGVTIVCDNLCIDCGGHGKNEKDAFEVFVQKCGKD